MNRFHLYIVALAMLLIVSCKSEKNVASYEVLYKESPATILIGPIHTMPNVPMSRPNRTRCSTPS